MRLLLSLALLAMSPIVCAWPNKQDFSPRAAFRDACNLSRYTCKGLRVPLVRESVFVDKAGVHGMYFGGHTVWLSPGLTLTPGIRYAIMVHEMVHYLQYYEDDKGFPHSAPYESCLWEEEAYEVSDQILIRLGLPEQVRAERLRATCE